MRTKDLSIEFRGEGGGKQGRCEQRSEVFVKIQKRNWGGGQVGGRGQDGYERRIEVFVKIKKIYMLGGRGVRGSCLGGGGSG